MMAGVGCLRYLITLIIISTSEALRFQCGDKSLSGPVSVASYKDYLSEICKDFSVSSSESLTGVSVVVEAGDEMLPGTGLELLRAPLTFPLSEEFRQSLQRTHLETLSSTADKCGVFYLIVSAVSADGEILDFDSLELIKKCSDFPGLSLKVVRKSDEVLNNIRRGSVNPFKIIGIDSISVVNTVQNCSKDSTDCSNQTDIQPRWEAAKPDVVAFYVPLSWQETAPDDSDSLLNKMGFSNGTSNNWYIDEPDALNNLIKLGLENMNMFQNPIFLHNHSLLNLESTMLSGFKVGQNLGELDLDKTSIPDEAPRQGLLVVALDPLYRFEDIDRTDNIFVQYVTVMDNGDLENYPFCSVKELGRNAYMMYNNYYEEPKRIVFSGKRNGIKALDNRREAKMANKAQLLAQISTLKINSKKMSSCKMLKNINKRKSESNKLLINKVGNITELIARNFGEMDHQAELEGKQISLLLQVASQLVGVVAKDKRIMKMIMKLIKKNGPKPPNNPGHGFGSTDSNGGFKPGQNDFTSTWSDSTTTAPTFSSTYDWTTRTTTTTTDYTSVPWWQSSTPPPFWNSTFNWSNSTFDLSSVPWWQSSTPPPFWNSTFDWSNSTFDFTSVPWWQSSTPPPFWNSTFDWSNSTFDLSSVPWWQSSTPPPFWNSTFDWSNSTFDLSSVPWWQSSTPPPFWNSTFDWSNSTFDFTSVPWWQSSTPPPFWNSTFDWSNSTFDFTSVPWWQSSTPPPFWNSTFDWTNSTFPFFNTTVDLNKTIDQLEDELSKLDDGAFNTLLDNLDENSLYDLYEKMNGTNIANDIEETIFETGHDEEANSWENIFGDTGDFFRRRKRQTRGEVEEKNNNRPKDFEENIAPMMAMGLQGFLMMDGKDMGFQLPKILSRVPDCLKEILWETEGGSKNDLCARIPASLKSKLKELMMIVLNREISPKFVKINWPEIMKSLGDSGLVEELVKTVMSKAMVPVKATDVTEVLTLVQKSWKKVVDDEKDPDNKAILNLVTDLIKSLENPNIVSIATEIINEIQEMIVLKKGLAMMEGEMGKAPGADEMCDSYVRARLAGGGGGGGGERVWLRKAGGIYRGVWCPVTGSWYWARLALCGCSTNQCSINLY